MSSTWLYPFIIVAGLLQAAGAAMTGQLKTSLTNPFFGVSFPLPWSRFSLPPLLR